MRRYETIFIIDPDLSDENRDPVFERLRDIIEQHNGFLARVEQWGNRKLSYNIKKKVRGYYVRLDYCGTGILVNEIERFFRIDDRILKYLTVQLEKNADLDRIKNEIAQAEALEAEKHQLDQAISVKSDQLDESEIPISDSLMDVMKDVEAEKPEFTPVENNHKEQ